MAHVICTDRLKALLREVEANLEEEDISDKDLHHAIQVRAALLDWILDRQQPLPVDTT